MARPRALKRPELGGKEVALGVLFLLGALNYLAVWWWNYPFLYCWLGPVVRPLYVAWGNIANICATLYLLFAIVQRRAEQVGIAVVIVLAIGAVPQIADTLFRAGGTCQERHTKDILSS